MPVVNKPFIGVKRGLGIAIWSRVITFSCWHHRKNKEKIFFSFFILSPRKFCATHFSLTTSRRPGEGRKNQIPFLVRRSTKSPRLIPSCTLFLNWSTVNTNEHFCRCVDSGMPDKRKKKTIWNFFKIYFLFHWNIIAICRVFRIFFKFSFFIFFIFVFFQREKIACTTWVRSARSRTRSIASHGQPS